MSGEIRFNAFDMNCVAHQSPGLWRHPLDQSWRYKELGYWTDLAKLSERGLFDGLFIADVLGTYDAITPGTFEDVVRFVVPELQRRGVYRTEYTPGTLRHKLFGEGDRLPEGDRAQQIVREVRVSRESLFSVGAEGFEPPTAGV